MIGDEVEHNELTITPTEFFNRMPAEFRQEIDSLLAAGWKWGNKLSFDQRFRLIHPQNDEIWIHINYPKYEIAMSVERAWQLKVENVQVDWGVEE
jgi:hypothetical protein